MSKCYASAVLAIAAAEIGYHEKKSNSQLDNPTANAGSANYTKYARDFDEKYPKWYNGKKNGFAWCDMFVDWCMLTAFGYADALRLLCQPERSAGAGCTYSLMYYEKQSRYHDKDPKPGDQIFFSTAHSKIRHSIVRPSVLSCLTAASIALLTLSSSTLKPFCFRKSMTYCFFSSPRPAPL